MNKAEVIALAAEIEGAKYDFPFDEDFETVVFRHKGTGRWFGVVLAAPNDRIGVLPESGKSDVLNVKVPPELGVLLKENYKSAADAYHMNKTHWISIVLGGDADGEIGKLLRLSFDLTEKRSKKR